MSHRIVTGGRWRKLLALAVAPLIAIPVAVGLVASPAMAAGSDDPTPYTVDQNGITLPAGSVFKDGDHINLTTTQGSKSIHFESLNWPDDHPKKHYIGKQFIPWSAFGLTGSFCVSWVQVAGFNEHYGEGGQPPACVNPPPPSIKECLDVTEQRFKKEITNSHKEYRYPVETRSSVPSSHTEWRFQTRTPLHGEVEYKDVKGWQFVDGGTVRVNGQTISGHWQQGNSGTFYHIPGSIINAVWGSGGIPNQYMGTGTVNLSTYGGPNQTVQYSAYKEATTEGFTPWGPWSDWSTTNPGSSNDTRSVETRTVDDPPTYTPWVSAGYTDWSTSSTKPADTATTRYGTVQSRTVDDPPTIKYYLPGGGTSDTLTDANWTTDTPSAHWTLVDSRTIPVAGDCVPTPPTWVDECGPDNGHWSYTNGSWYSFFVNTNNDGSITVTAVPNTGRAFAPGTVTTWTMTDSNEACPLPKDATAAIGTTPPTCDTDGSAYVTGLVHASLVGTLNTAPGSHTATFAAETGHLFANGTATLEVPYTVLGQLGNCLDASAAVTVSPPACGVDGSASLGTLTFASLVGTLNTAPGSHTATFAAETGHLFANGTATLEVPYTVLGALPFQYTDENGACYVNPPEKEDDVEVTEGTWVCDDTDVTVTTVTTTYTFDFDSKTGTFSAPIPHVGDPVHTKRQLTLEESKQDCAAPTLDGTIAAGVCRSNAPYLTYDIVLNDPDSQSTDNGTATITFLHPTDSSEDWSRVVPIGAGQILWPGASVNSSGTAVGWPGWAQVNGSWQSIGDGNYGWTRAVDTKVEIRVNPSVELTVSYPPATPNCTDPPEVCKDKDGNEHPKGSAACTLATTGAEDNTLLLIGISTAALLAGIALFGWHLKLRTRRRLTS